MDVMTAIKKRRSVRKFKDRPVDRNTILKLLEAAVWSPSGGNAQTWRFVVVTDPEKKKKIKMDSAMAAQNLMLAACAEGLGTCVIASFHADAVRKLLGLPEEIVPQLMISVGEPDQEPLPPPRKFVEIVWWEAYGG